MIENGNARLLFQEDLKNGIKRVCKGVSSGSNRNMSVYAVRYGAWVSAPGDAICSSYQNKPLKCFVQFILYDISVGVNILHPVC